MIFAWLGIYITAWACAYLAVHRLPGRAGYWMGYLLAVIGGPAAFGGLAFLIYRSTERGAALDLGQFIMAVGALVAALAYPIQHWRCRRKARR